MKAPPYKPPRPMADLADPGPGAPTLISTFTGAGGACLGYRWAGFRPLLASEFVEAARDTYTANFPATPVLPDDIRELTGRMVCEAAGVEPGDLDLLEGSPPCAAFSTAGVRDDAWGETRSYSDTEQRVDDLFFEFTRLVGDVQPRVFAAENVAGLVRGKAKGYFKQIHKALEDCGYRVEAVMLDAQWLGVPQRRRRLLFQGVRNDLHDTDGLPLMPSWPTPFPWRWSLADALGLSSKVTVQQDARGYFPGANSPAARGPSPTVTSNPDFFMVGDESPLDPETGERIDLTGYAIGDEADYLGPGGQSDRFFSLVRPKEDEPSPTVTASGGALSTAGVIHSGGRRKFTLGELRRVCGFPDDFALTGSFAQRWERLGRAVPPPMTEALGRAIREGVLDKAAPT